MINIPQIESKVHERLHSESTGHDFYHIDRVRKMALLIAKAENVTQNSDLNIIESAALLHDIPDRKLHANPEFAMQEVADWLNAAHATPQEIIEICSIINGVSYKGAHVETPMHSLNGKIVQDADRLDALGAIGIARCFAYGGSKKRPIYNPQEQAELHTNEEAYFSSNNSSLQHFYEKLLLLKDRMQTKTGTKFALERHAFLENYLTQFFKEWNCEY